MNSEIYIENGSTYPERAVIVNADFTEFHPMGGGFAYKPKSKEDFLSHFHKATEAERKPPLRPGIFTVGNEESHYPGFHRGFRWNGWACPSFEKGIADKIVADTHSENFRFEYDAAKDAFIHHDADYPDEKPTEFAGRDEALPDETLLHLYSIGDGWCWDEVESPN